MDIRHLRHFLAVVETGSFHAAAEKLGLTQQAISRSIKSLETELGVRLIERRARDRRKVGPTEFGKLLLPHAISVAKDLQNLKAQFDNLLGLRHTLIRFAATPTAMRRLVGPALSAFRTRRPKLRVQAMQMVLPSIVTRLNEGAFDFIIADEPSEPLSEKYAVERILTDHSVVICGNQHPLRNLTVKQLSAEVLFKQQWIGFGPFMPTMRGFQSLFSSGALEGPSRLLETSSLDLTISELRSNRYLAVLPRELIRAELDLGELIELPIPLDPIKGWDISIIRMIEHPLSPAVQDFLDCLRSVARSNSLTTA
jgi:DNA-binding transcriptional LysR family regulator